MVRRRWQVDPELAPVARERLARALRVEGGRDREESTLLDLAGSPPEVGDLVEPRRFTRWHLGVVGALLVLGLLWGGWSLLRARPVALGAPTAVQTASAPSAPTPGQPLASASASPTAAVRLVVHVLGAVRDPGLVRLPEPARVQDAIEAAGGLARDADPGELNLAQALTDGEQVVIGTKKHPSGEVRSGAGSGGATSGTGSASGDGGSGGAGGGGAVDLNRATLADLDALPGVGPVTAQKILDWREQHGRFSRPEELQEVDGIGPKTYAQLASRVRV